MEEALKCLSVAQKSYPGDRMLWDIFLAIEQEAKKAVGSILISEAPD